MIDTQAVSPGMDSVMRRLHIRLFFDLSQANIFISNYTEAMNNLLHILDKYVTDSIADRGIIAQCYNNMGSVFLIRGHNSMALEYYNRSLELFRKQKNLEGEGMLHGNIGNVYNSMGLSEEALKHHLSNYNILVKLGKEDNALAHAILNLGLAYQGLGEYQVADKYYNEAKRRERNMFKQNLFRAKMMQLELSTKDVADIMQCSMGSVYRKIRGESDFTRREIQLFCSKCNLSERELLYIFFGK